MNGRQERVVFPIACQPSPYHTVAKIKPQYVSTDNWSYCYYNGWVIYYSMCTVLSALLHYLIFITEFPGEQIIGRGRRGGGGGGEEEMEEEKKEEDEEEEEEEGEKEGQHQP